MSIFEGLAVPVGDVDGRRASAASCDGEVLIDGVLRGSDPGPSSALTAAAAGSLDRGGLPRTSEVLRGILTNNPGVKVFSVERILASIGTDRLETSLMMFSLPAIVPIGGPRGISALPTSALAYQILSGEKKLRLPPFVLKKAISRRALAVAIHASLPVIEAVEKIARPRWLWLSHSRLRQALGLFVLLLALGLAFPLFGLGSLHATSIFVIALGMAEQDGLAMLIGVVAGALSLAIIAARGASVRALRARAVRWLHRVGKRLGLQALARVLRSRGYVGLAKLLTLEWSKILLLWDPEKPAVGAAVTPVAQQATGGVPRAPVPRAAQVRAVPVTA